MSTNADDHKKRWFRKVSKAWVHAGQDLGVKVTAPYEIRSGSRGVIYAAYLHEFGSQKGTLVGVLTPPDLMVDEEAKQVAERAGMYVSFVSPEGYDEYRKDLFIETLQDWGYFGPEKHRPQWLEQEGGNK